MWAGCGRQISVVLKMDGMPYMMGKFKYHNMKFDDYRKCSRPMPVWNEKVSISKVVVGYDHYQILDKNGSLYSCGENETGALGFGDNKSRRSPILNPFFENKRVIDFSCGTGFTVIIAETFILSIEQEKEYFNNEKKSLSDIGKTSRTGKKMVSEK